MKCRHCSGGVVLPSYRKGLRPTFRCNRCRVPYIPKAKNTCPHDPQETQGPIGMYHCPECGVMVLAGMGHPDDYSVRLQGLSAYGDS
jgi:hypothetical protein